MNRSFLKLLSFLLIAFLVSCSDSSDKIAPSDYMTTEEVDTFKRSIIRYVGKLPGKANHVSKFNPEFNEYYDTLAVKHNLKAYYIDRDSAYHYFLMTRIAPSLERKLVAIGGRLKYGNDGKIQLFEETFRTWKMPEEELDKTGLMLFKKMIQKEELSQYYTENSGSSFIIEFPSSDVTYDADKRMWVSKNEDPMEYLYKMKEQSERDAKKLEADSLK